MMSEKKAPLALTASLLLVASLSACGPASSASDPKGSEADSSSLKIGFVNADTLEFHKCLEKGADTAATKQKVELIKANSTRDPGKELSNVEDMIVRQVDAIVLQTVNIDALKNAVAKANAAQIPIFLTSVVGPDKETILGAVLSDVEENGRMSAEWLNKDSAGAAVKVGIIAGAPGASSDLFVSGFKGALGPKAEVVFQQPGMFQRAKAQEVAENLLQAQPGVNYVFVPNEEMAFGALTAFKAAGREDIKILTNGGTPAGLAAVKDKGFAVLVASSPADMGSMAVSSTVDLLTKKGDQEKLHEIPLTIITPDTVTTAPKYCGE